MRSLRCRRVKGPRIDYSGFSLSKGTPAVLERHDKRTEHEKKLAACYAKVDERDESICWVTGVTLTPFAENEKFRREHHHLKGRNVKPEWVYDQARVVTVSSAVHKLLQSHALEAFGTDARKPIYFAWNPNMVDIKRPPFRLRESVRRAA